MILCGPMYSGIPQHHNFDLFGLNCRKAMRDRERNENSYRAAPHASLVGHVKTGSPLQWYRLLIDVDPPFCCNGAKKTHLLHDDLWGSTWCTIWSSPCSQTSILGSYLDISLLRFSRIGYVTRIFFESSAGFPVTCCAGSFLRRPLLWRMNILCNRVCRKFSTNLAHMSIQSSETKWWAHCNHRIRHLKSTLPVVPSL